MKVNYNDPYIDYLFRPNKYNICGSICPEDISTMDLSNFGYNAPYFTCQHQKYHQYYFGLQKCGIAMYDLKEGHVIAHYCFWWPDKIEQP